MTMLGRQSSGRRVPSWASRRWRQRRFMASTASMMASEEPTVEVPTALPDGAWNRSPIMLVQRAWMSAERGYSS